MKISTIIQLPKIADPKGKLTFLQNPDQVPYLGEETPKSVKTFRLYLSLQSRVKGKETFFK